MKTKLNYLFATLFITMFLNSCINYDDEIDDLQNQITELKEIQSLLELKNILYYYIAEEILVTEISEVENNIILVLENSQRFSFDKSLVTNYVKDKVNWKLNFVLNDSTEINVFFLGNKFIFNDLSLNPFNSAPLSLLINKKTPLSGLFNIKVKGQDGPNSDFHIKTEILGKNHVLKIFGLYADYENEIEISFTNKDGIVRSSSTIYVKTEELPANLPAFNVLKEYETNTQNTLILINYRIANIPFMVDTFGKVRWYSNKFTSVQKYGLQRLKNGNIAFGTAGDGQGSVIEYTMMGELVRIYDFYGEYENAHHDVFEMSNGNFLVAVNKVGIETVEDFIIEIDRNSGMIGNIWDLREILQMDRYTFRKIGDGSDWFHVNAVIHDPRDNSIIVSGQAQGLAKISWQNELIWVLAPHEGWDEKYKSYLLNPKGNSFEWSWGQHAPQILNNGNLMQFDNGFGREFGNASSNYSRAVEYNIEESNMGGDITQVWQYGKERGEEMFSSVISDIDYIEDTQTVFITAGSTALDIEYTNLNTKFKVNLDEVETRIIEVNRQKDVLFEMTLKSPGRGTTYRSEKLIFK